MMRRVLDRVLHDPQINYAVTNRIPRLALSRWVGRLSRLEQPLARDLSIAVFKWFAGDLRLHEAQQSEFASLRDIFTRRLKASARPIAPHPDVLISPCDGILGACGRVNSGTLLQAKGLRYSLEELLGDHQLTTLYDGGTYVTLRLTTAMYHRFHAPADGSIDRVQFFRGELFNVNPPTVARLERLFCRNERAVMPISLADSAGSIALVAVGAILVGSIRLAFVETPLNQGYRGPDVIRTTHRFVKGDELGYFEHGSTILVLATPGLELCPTAVTGSTIRMGEPLLRRLDPPRGAR